jgi:hypothetical protein
VLLFKYRGTEIRNFIFNAGALLREDIDAQMHNSLLGDYAVSTAGSLAVSGENIICIKFRSLAAPGLKVEWQPGRGSTI